MSVWNMEYVETTPDDPSKLGSGALKYDGGKSPVFRGVIEYFPRAVLEVGKVSQFGANKYAWRGWEGVDDGFSRYSDALMRHMLYESQGWDTDPDSNLLHATHVAWNALARLELLLRKNEKE